MSLSSGALSTERSSWRILATQGLADGLPRLPDQLVSPRIGHRDWCSSERRKIEGEDEANYMTNVAI